MMYLIFAARVTLSVAATLLGLAVVPIALLLGGVNNPLPSWAWPWNNDVDPFGDYSRKPAIDAATGFKKGWLRFVWLALRNPVNNLADQLGAYTTAEEHIDRQGDQLTSDQYRSGWKFNKLYQSDKYEAFEFYFVRAYSANRCLRIRLGWKLDDPQRPLVHVINPFMTFTGADK